jgi:hypothetical protein
MNYDSLHQGNWRTIIENEMEYNPSNQLSKTIVSIRDIDGNTENSTMSEYSYSGTNLEEVVISRWDDASQSWEVNSKQEYEYTNDLISKSTFYQWNEVTTDWDIFMETTFDYDNERREIESISKMWDVSEGQFMNSDKTTTEYYEGLKISRQESKSWDMVNEEWSNDNYTLYEHQYDNNGNEIEHIFTSAFGFGGFSILIKSRSTYEYDSNNYLILQNNFNFDEITQSWIESGKVEYTNDASGLVQHDIHYLYDGSIYLNYEKNIYNYEDVVDVDNRSELPTDFVLHQNYPNPFNPSTVISFSVPKTSNVSVIIYDVLGNVISNLVDERLQAGEYRTTFDVSKLSNISSGVYIISLRTNEISLTKKCLLLK